MIILPDKSIVVLDIETTEVALAEARGGVPQPIEIAGCWLDCEYEVRGEFSTLVRPEPFEDFTEFCESFTGISREELSEEFVGLELGDDSCGITNYQIKRIELIVWERIHPGPAPVRRCFRAKTVVVVPRAIIESRKDSMLFASVNEEDS